MPCNLHVDCRLASRASSKDLRIDLLLGAKKGDRGLSALGETGKRKSFATPVSLSADRVTAVGLRSHASAQRLLRTDVTHGVHRDAAHVHADGVAFSGPRAEDLFPSCQCVVQLLLRPRPCQDLAAAERLFLCCRLRCGLRRGSMTPRQPAAGAAEMPAALKEEGLLPCCMLGCLLRAVCLAVGRCCTV